MKWVFLFLGLTIMGVSLKDQILPLFSSNFKDGQCVATEQFGRYGHRLVDVKGKLYKLQFNIGEDFYYGDLDEFDSWDEEMYEFEVECPKDPKAYAWTIESWKKTGAYMYIVKSIQGDKK